MDDFPQAAFEIAPGWMNAAGMLGFAPPSSWPLPYPPVSFITNPVSYKPRSPSNYRTSSAFPGGMLCHTGWPNPGFGKVLKLYAKRWMQSEVPIWVHLLGDEPYEVNKMVRRLEEIDNVSAIEISLPLQIDTGKYLELISAAQGELPIVVNIPLDQINADWLGRTISSSVSVVSLGVPRGSIRDEGGKLIQGRLYGPSMLPQAVMAVKRLKSVGLPIIAGCGVYSEGDIQTMIDVGAAAVQLDLVLWRGWEVAG